MKPLWRRADSARDPGGVGAPELTTLMEPFKVGDRWEIEGRAFVVAADKTDAVS